MTRPAPTRSLRALATLVVCAAVSACTMASVHQTPDVLPEGFSQVTVETGGGYLDGMDLGETMVPWSVAYRGNVGERTEAGLKYGAPGGFYVDIKHALGRQGATHIATGGIAGTIQLENPAGFFSVPVYLGWEWGSNMLYAAVRPAVIGEQFRYFSDRDDVLFGGGTVAFGVRSGERSGFYVEAAYGRTVGRRYAPTDATDVQTLYLSIAPFYNRRTFPQRYDPWYER